MLRIFIRFLILFFLILLLCLFWLRGGTDKLYLDSDIARDLSEISKLWIGQKIIWLGPRFSMGLHSSPIYYYLFYIPIWVSRGDAHSIVVFNVMIAASVLFILGVFAIKKYGIKGILIPLFIGLMPWWQNLAIHPGNGSTYAIFIMLFLTLIWFELPIFISSLALGISISMHPGAFLGLPVLLYELIKKKSSFKKYILSLILFLIPFLPLIIFELITKGYWLRNWFDKPKLGLDVKFGFDNIRNFYNYSGVNLYLALVMIFYLIVTSEKRHKVWLVFCLLVLLITTFFVGMPIHYLFALMILFWFLVAFALIKKNIGKMILIIFSIYFALNSTVFSDAPEESERSISKIYQVVDSAIKEKIIDRQDRLAVLALKDRDTKTPQADDYRFFLRVEGYRVEEVSDYAKADKLIIFVEDKNIDWKNWSSWETEQFGPKDVSEIYEINGIIIAVYKKQNA